MKTKLKLGCDPELFLMDAEGKLKAACGLIGGSKAHPMPLPIGEGYAVQEDNVAMEFNIPPAANAKEFVDSITKTLVFLRDNVRLLYNFDISKRSAESFDKNELAHPGASVFGCDPDYNAWTMKRNPKPQAEDENLRSCGGHIHVGYEGNDLNPVQLIRMMDLYLGVPSVLMDHGELRKQLYGKAGAFRKKSYGVEYRTLSNFWVVNELAEWAWNNTAKAVEAVESQFAVDDYKDRILDAIDNNNKTAAESLVKEFHLEVI